MIGLTKLKIESSKRHKKDLYSQCKHSVSFTRGGWTMETQRCVTQWERVARWFVRHWINYWSRLHQKVLDRNEDRWWRSSMAIEIRIGFIRTNYHCQFFKQQGQMRNGHGSGSVCQELHWISLRDGGANKNKRLYTSVSPEKGDRRQAIWSRATLEKWRQATGQQEASSVPSSWIEQASSKWKLFKHLRKGSFRRLFEIRRKWKIFVTWRRQLHATSCCGAKFSLYYEDPSGF